MKCLADLWLDESAAVISAELIMVLTILCIGTVVGMTSLRDAIVTELADLGAAIGCLNQSYSYAGVTSSTATFAGSSFFDRVDTCDDGCTQPENANSRCVVICDVAATHEGQN